MRLRDETIAFYAFERNLLSNANTTWDPHSGIIPPPTAKQKLFERKFWKSHYRSEEHWQTEPPPALRLGAGMEPRDQEYREKCSKAATESWEQRRNGKRLLEKKKGRAVTWKEYDDLQWDEFWRKTRQKEERAAQQSAKKRTKELRSEIEAQRAWEESRRSLDRERVQMHTRLFLESASYQFWARFQRWPSVAEAEENFLIRGNDGNSR